MIILVYMGCNRHLLLNLQVHLLLHLLLHLLSVHELWLLHHHLWGWMINLQGIYPIGSIHDVEDQVKVVFENSFLLDHILNLENIETHFLAVLVELFFQLLGVKVKRLARVAPNSHRKLLSNPLSFSFVGRFRENTSFEEVLG